MSPMSTSERRTSTNNQQYRHQVPTVAELQFTRGNASCVTTSVTEDEQPRNATHEPTDIAVANFEEKVEDSALSMHAKEALNSDFKLFVNFQKNHCVHRPQTIF